MPILDTPITANDNTLNKVLAQKKPTILIFHKTLDTPLEDALRSLAQKHSGKLFLVKLAVDDAPIAYEKYNSPALPALIALEHGFMGAKVKSQAERIRPKDLRAHVEYLLTDKPLPQPKEKSHQNTGQSRKQSHGAREVTSATFQREVLKSKQPVLVDFWAPWCGPCRAIAPTIDRLADEYAGRVKVVKVNTDQNRQLAMQYQIQSIPTTILFKDGKPVQRIIGANAGAIQNALRSAVN